MAESNRHPASWILIAVLATACVSPVAAEDKLEQRVHNATEAYRELLRGPDRGVPEALLKNCHCVAVFPHVLKGALGWGAEYGHGVISCRNAAGDWSPICFLTLTGGSAGFQIGGESSDFVLFFMTDRGARSLLSSKFTLGGKASVAAGPSGRSAQASTDIKLSAEIYSYARARGLFAGVSLEGARLAPDEKSNRSFYRAAVVPESLLFSHRAPKQPAASLEFRGALP